MATSKKITVLTGAGISAESGISTFRDANGLWENHDIMEVASYQGWLKNKELILKFYNDRRRQLKKVQPNAGHLGLVQLEAKYDVTIVTQNVDNLHERAGSNKILHLHGELTKVRSTADEDLVYEWHDDLRIGDRCEKGSQLRPHIVWFGEMVPMLEEAARVVSESDMVVIIGTSMQVYPAASLIDYADYGIPIYYIDPNPSINTSLKLLNNLKVIEAPASRGVGWLLEELL